MTNKKIKVSVILSKEEHYEGNVFVPIGVLHTLTKENIYSVLCHYSIDHCLEDSEENKAWLDEIADYLYNDKEYDDFKNSDFAFKIETTFLFE